MMLVAAARSLPRVSVLSRALTIAESIPTSWSVIAQADNLCQALLRGAAAKDLGAALKLNRCT
jgi:hypothetical protein